MPLALKLDRCDVALQNDTSKVALHALLEAGVLPRFTKKSERRYFVSLPGFIFVVVLIYTFSYLARRDRPFDVEKNSSWMMRKASSASASKTTNEILTLDAPWLSISTFTPRCASTVKTRAINSVDAPHQQ